MKSFHTVILGILVILALCGAIVTQVLSSNVYATSGAWALLGVLLLAWFVMNRAAVARFLVKKSTRYGANVALVIFLVLGILVFVNVIAKQHPLKKDLTRTQSNTLSEQSRKILSGLSGDVTAYFFAGQGDKEKGEDVLKRYADFEKHFHYEFVDVERFPTRAAAMGVKRRNTVILTLAGTNKNISVDQPTEEQVTNGLIKLLRSSQVAVYFTSGHDEHPLEGEADQLGYSQLKGQLELAGYTVKDLNLFSTGKVPEDAAVVVVGGARKAFFPKELDVLSAWIKDGGHAVIAVDLDVQAGDLAKGSKQLAELLKPYGVNVMNQMLVDPTSKVANVEPQILLGIAGRSHPVTKDFPHSAMGANFLFPLTTYLTHTQNPAVQITSLANTTPQAWAESDWASLQKGRASFDPTSDHQGVMDLAYAVEGKKPEGQSQPSAKAVKLAVFADALFVTNNLIDKVGNRDLMLNTIAWLANEDRFISIRAAEDQDGLKQYNNVVLNLILIFTVFVFPLLLVGMGTYVWWRRSKL